LNTAALESTAPAPLLSKKPVNPNAFGVIAPKPWMRPIHSLERIDDAGAGERARREPAACKRERASHRGNHGPERNVAQRE
jgi:hypothetical protein